MAGFLDELTKRVYTNAIATVSSDEGGLVFDIQMDESGDLIFCHSSAESALLQARLIRLLGDYNMISLVLRSFTERRHEQSRLPIKELRGYVLGLDGNDVIQIAKLSKSQLFDACNTNAITGEPLTPEIAVEYCDDSQ